MAVGNIIYSTSSSTIVSGDAINASDFERSTNLQVDTTTGNLNIAGSVNATGGIVASGTSNLGSVGSVKISGGSSGQVLSTDGSSNLSWATISIPSRVEVFTTTTVWTAPAGVTRVHFKALGGGAGGGRQTNETSRAGGGAGGFIEAYITVIPGTSYEIYVGGGGTGASTNGTDGEAGGATGFKIQGGAIICQANGGNGPAGGGSVNNSATVMFTDIGGDGLDAQYTDAKTPSLIQQGRGGINSVVRSFFYQITSPLPVRTGLDSYYGQGGMGGSNAAAATSASGFAAGGGTGYSVGASGGNGAPGIAFLNY